MSRNRMTGLLGAIFGITMFVFTLTLIAATQASKSEPKLAFQYLTEDSVLLDIYETYDHEGLLDGYGAHVTTPVCNTGLCYEAELDFYWDVLGNFRDFEILPDKPLTKLDHVPFEDSDYERLKAILLTKSPSFIHLRRDELVVTPFDTDPQDVDAVGGATLKHIEKDMVEGAIYTCYTLWHIANGDINFQMQEHTIQNLEKDLLGKMLDSDNVDAHYFAAENMDPAYFEVFITQIARACKSYGQYFTDRIYSRLPDHLDLKLQGLLEAE
ncbi:MAG: hypothetical protein KI791_17400 [Cyclobacteriaceae bacterium]|nr:hypothetical protein [Cyclobacteriaceae bacterium SS2]